MQARTGSALLLVLATAIVAACLVPATALAWVSNGDPGFGGRTIAWYGAAPSSRVDIRAAAAAIDATGVRARLVEVHSRARADIVLERPGPDRMWGSTPCTGTTRNNVRNGVRTPSTITWRPCVPASSQPVFVRRAHAATQRLLAHELMHAYGLAHEQRRCATMNAPSIGVGSQVVPFRCASIVGAAPPGMEYCRIVEADDQVGLIARYGGRRRPLPPQLCAFAGIAPPPVFTVTAVNLMPPGAPPDWNAHISWSGLGADVSGLRIVTASHPCAAGAAPDPGVFSQGPYDVQTTGPSESRDFQTPTAGTWCITATPFVRDDEAPISPAEATGVPVQREVVVPASD